MKTKHYSGGYVKAKIRFKQSHFCPWPGPPSLGRLFSTCPSQYSHKGSCPCYFKSVLTFHSTTAVQMIADEIPHSLRVSVSFSKKTVKRGVPGGSSILDLSSKP